MLPRGLLWAAAAFALSACTTKNPTNAPDGAANSETGVNVLWSDPNTLPDGTPNPCLGATNCADCTARTPCGWCGDRCLSGIEAQSHDGTCSGDSWDWRGVQCPGTGAQCPSHTDCASCAADENSCGWCANTRQCMAGDSRGPASSVDGCSPAQNTWIYNLERQTCQ